MLSVSGKVVHHAPKDEAPGLYKLAFTVQVFNFTFIMAYRYELGENVRISCIIMVLVNY